MQLYDLSQARAAARGLSTSSPARPLPEALAQDTRLSDPGGHLMRTRILCGVSSSRKALWATEKKSIGCVYEFA